MKRTKSDEDTMRITRALYHICIVLTKEWVKVKEADDEDESWHAELIQEREASRGDPNRMAREISELLGDEVPLPGLVNRTELVRACHEVRQGIDTLSRDMKATIEQAAVHLRKSSWVEEQKSQEKSSSSEIPPCPKEIGDSTHETLWRIIPEGWFNLRSIYHNPECKCDKRTIRKWYSALKPTYLEYNKKHGAASCYRKVTSRR